MARSSFQLWNCSALLGVLLTLGSTQTADAGFFDWLFGRNQELYPIGSYDLQTGQPVQYGQAVQSGYGTYNASAYGAAPSYGSVGTSYGCTGSLPVYPTYPNYPSNPNIPPVLPTATASPPPTFQSYWNRAPVTYYRPVTVYSPVTGTNVTQLQACTSYEYQTQRVPILAFRPLFGSNATTNTAYYPGSAQRPVAASGSSNFISVPQSGMSYTPPTSMPYAVGYVPLTGANLAGTLPPSMETPNYGNNPVPSYPPPVRSFAPGTMVPGTMQPQSAMPMNSFPVVPGTTLPPTGLNGPTMPAIGTGIVPQTPGFTSPAPIDSMNGSAAPGSSYWNQGQPVMPPNNNGSLSDPESSVTPSLPTTSLPTTSPMASSGPSNGSKPRFGISRVSQEPQSSTGTSAAPPIPQTLKPQNLIDQIKPIPAPDGSDLTPQWNRGLLDSRDLTAFNSSNDNIREIEPSNVSYNSVSMPIQASSIQQASATTEARFEGSAVLRPSTEIKMKLGRVVEIAKPIAAPQSAIDSSGWVSNKK